MFNQAKTLVQLQLELVDIKVDKTVSQAIQQVVEQIINLRQEVHQEMGGLRDEMHKEFFDLKNRMVAVETRLGMKSEWQREFRTRFFDYGFKAAWLVLGSGILYLLYSLHAHLVSLAPLLH